MKEGWKSELLDTVCEVEYGTRVVRKKDAGTIYPVYGGGGATFSMDTFNRENRLVIGRFAMSEKCTRFVKGKFFLNDSGLTVSPKVEDLNQAYLDWYMLSKNSEIYDLGKGSAQRNLNVDEFRKIIVNYPNSLSEQERIVKILDAAFEKIDRLKQNAEKGLQEVKNLWEARLSNLFEAKDGWTNSNLGSLVDFKNGVNFTPSEYGTKIKFLGVGDFKDRVTITSSDLDYISTNQTIDKEYHLQKDDIIIVRSNGSKTLVGRTVIFNENIDEPLIYSGFCIRCRIKDKSLLPGFLNILFRTTKVKRHLTYGDNGCNISNINQKKLSSLQIFYPSIEDQQKIVEEYEHLSLLCKRLTFNYEQELSEYEALKQSILRKAFSGEL